MEAVEKAHIVDAIFRNPHRKQNLTKEEADKVGELLGQVKSKSKSEIASIVPVFELTWRIFVTCSTRVTQELIEKYQQNEAELRHSLLEAKREAGRKIIKETGIEYNTEAQLEQVLRIMSAFENDVQQRSSNWAFLS